MHGRNGPVLCAAAAVLPAHAASFDVKASGTGGLALTPRGGVKLEMSRRRAQAFRERMSL